MELGKRILTIRKENDLTQDELAEICSVTRQTISNWENGVCLPDVSVYEELCSALNITLNEFLAGEDLAPEKNNRTIRKEYNGCISRR